MDGMTAITQEQHQLEQAFAGAVLIGGDYARESAGWLSPDVFTDKRIGNYWERVQHGSDPVQVGFELKMGPELLKWSQSVTSSLDTDKYAKALQRANWLRFMLMGATDIAKHVQAGNDEEIEAVLDAMKNEDSGASSDMRSAKEAAENLKFRVSQGNISILFGIDSLDQATAGAERGTLTVVGARTSMGKSSLVFQWAEHQALRLGLKVGFFALEMSAEQMIARRVCHRVKNADGVSASWQDVRSGNVNKVELETLYKLIDEYADQIDGKLFISDKTYVTSTDILRTQLREKFDVIYVDHMGLLKDRPRSGERHDQLLGRISMSLHELAKNTHACVFAIAQLKRAVAERENKRPRLDDLQDSTKIESNSDNIMLLDRPSYWDDSVREDPDPMEVILAKYRDGARSLTAWVGFHLSGQRFVSIERPNLDDVITEKMEAANGQPEIPF